MSQLLSHPDRALEQHIEEVIEGIGLILQRHSGNLDLRNEMLIGLARLHDIGKMTPEFQAYIQNPRRWRGDPVEKAHTPLGLLLSSVTADLGGKDLDWKLSVCLSILGHHSSLPVWDEVHDKLRSDEWCDVLTRQLGGLPWAEVERFTGLPREMITGTPAKRLLSQQYRAWRDVFDSLAESAECDLPGAVGRRLAAQLVFSILLEADRLHLALSEDGLARYSGRQARLLSPGLVDQYVSRLPDSPINGQRQMVRRSALRVFREHSGEKLFTLTLPTGMGKTMTAASIAFDRIQSGAKKIIIVLPFLSVIDQTVREYQKLLSNPGTSTLMESHSLSERVYDDSEGRDTEFLLDTWQSDIVLTTFDQFLLALFSSEAKHQMRFHNLADAAVVLDEVQAIPTHLWHPVGAALTGLSRQLNTTVLAMSATQPGYVEGAVELVEDRLAVYRQFNRYRLVLKHRQPETIDELADRLFARANELGSKRVLITLNTRKSARALFDALDGRDCPGRGWPARTCFLSADVTPKDRLSVIEWVKGTTEPCLVVSTQVVEAGVDLDMDYVIRDFAPFDSLIQVAGRCNRNGGPQQGDVEIVRLVNDSGEPYAESVYKDFRGGPDLSLQETRDVLEPYGLIHERDILELCDDYFMRLRRKKNLGVQFTTDWAGFRQHIRVSELLRGDSSRQVQLVVCERDDDPNQLEALVHEALEVRDRWERRRRLRQLAPRLARVTVSVWETQAFDPSRVAVGVGPYWFLRSGFYDSVRGIDLSKSGCAWSF